jgi:hypothetical protein
MLTVHCKLTINIVLRTPDALSIVDIHKNTFLMMLAAGQAGRVKSVIEKAYSCRE